MFEAVVVDDGSTTAEVVNVVGFGGSLTSTCGAITVYSSASASSGSLGAGMTTLVALLLFRMMLFGICCSLFCDLLVSDSLELRSVFLLSTLD